MQEAISPIVEYKDSDLDPQNYVLIKVDIEGLIKKTFSKEAANAKIDFEVKERSFTLAVDVLDKQHDTLKHYKYQILQLPAEITPTAPKTFYKVKDGEIELHLHKCQPRPWSAWLASKGLEHYQEPKDN